MRQIYRCDISIFSPCTGSKVVSRCRRELQVLIEQQNITLGHKDIPGNEEPDKLVKFGAARLTTSEIDSNVIPPLSHYI